MKYILLTIILTSCASVPPSKRAMMNCVNTKDNYSICEEIPAHISGSSVAVPSAFHH